jgi:hypothetical protein
MRLVMTLLARNEADIVDAQIAFHLHAGVDFLIATENRSDDGTLEILGRYARAGHLHLLQEHSDDMRQDEWVTRMARLAATDFDADWVINSDADEFWWPRGGTLKDVLGLVPERYGVVRGCWRHFLPRPAAGDPGFAERMTVRLCAPAHPGDKSTIYHAHQKVAHRASSDVEIERGNHNATGHGLEPLRGWHPIEVLHFSLRSVEQVERKALGGWMRGATDAVVGHQLALDSAVREGRAREFFDTMAVSDSRLEKGLADGSLAVDTRLRDALRTLRAPDGTYRVPDPEPLLTFETPAVAETAAYAAEASVLAGIEGIVRAEQRVASLEARLVSLPTLPRR